MSAISDRSSDAVVKESAVRNSADSPCPATAVTTSSARSSVSQRRREGRGRAAAYAPRPA
ncbi:MAG: hypothetical protein AVDCRST_MAG13-389, partial [uncultured Solirubrobacteraceae bacterium]